MTRSLIYVSRGDLDLTSTSQGGSLVEKFEHLAGETAERSNLLRAGPGVRIRCSIFPLFEKFARRENTRLRIYRKSAELFTRSQGMQVVETSLVAQTEFQEWKLLASCELRRLRTDKEARTSVRESTRI